MKRGEAEAGQADRESERVLQAHRQLAGDRVQGCTRENAAAATSDTIERSDERWTGRQTTRIGVGGETE